MKHTLLCFIFLTLQDGNTGLVKAQTLTHRAEEGGSITVKCNFYFPGSRKLFCKEKCEDGNILVQTSDDAAQNGRYSIKYENSNNIMYVSITQLKQSDSGWYRCSLDRVLVTDGNSDFELIVTEASTTSTPNGTLRPFSASVFLSSASTPPTAQSLSSTSGSSTPSSASSGSSGPPVESERADITQGNNVYIEIREVDRQSSSPPAEVSSTDAAPKTSNQMEMKTIDLYSLSTSPHNKVHASSADHTADASPPHMSKNISSDAADESLVANR
ncbi:fas apoptotic inhibitory molecule 3 isoform X5 [Haplochromis burtoni]|uniref:fas apoptotic inhibitory molecule 3 isoform X5 n=1 Tax=Haplochromis burtoni TaxID=8153 RepID=UPI001C2D7251|nr:fas apoptotic inhibitory molecule 3 isoform X5 [Haplochromis burtoni]